MGGNEQICAEEFQIIYVADLPSRRWRMPPLSLMVGYMHRVFAQREQFGEGKNK